jgi:hypothetical protein
MPTTTIADTILGAVDVAEFLGWTRGYEVNELALADARVASACDHAMRGPIFAGYELGTPLLRLVPHDCTAIPLPMALDRWDESWMPACDRCHATTRADNRLVIPFGASWIMVHTCWDCHEKLSADFDALVWS